jgi:pimeloyl-ACP methyl ester carboxylesterase
VDYTIVGPQGLLVRAVEYLPDRPVDPDLPTVVLAHGWTLTNASWQPVISALQDRYAVRCVAYDQPGHGRSSAETPNPSVKELGDVLKAVLDVLAPHGQVVLGGHSMGGMTIMAYAGLHHTELVQRVRGVALVSTAASLEGRKPVPLERQIMAVCARAPRVAPGFLVPTRVQGAMIFGKGADAQDVRTAVQQIQQTKMPAIGRYFHALAHHDEIASLAHLEDVPTHILVGTRDRLTSPRRARELHELIPGSRLTELEDLGHMLTYEARDVVASALADYL